MPYVLTDHVLENLRQILQEELPKSAGDLQTRGPGTMGIPPVKEWLLDEWDFPDAGKGNYPRGIVTLDDAGRESERREQDTGETATIHIGVRLYFDTSGMSAGRARLLGMRYLDLIFYTVMRNAKGLRPKDGTVIPGLFRYWPRSGRIGETDFAGICGAEARIDVIVDTSDTFAATT